VHCCVSIEHKLGMGVHTAVLPVWRPAAPVSYIVVKKSTDYMFIMMNAARYRCAGITVIAEQTYQKSRRPSPG
jgi:hypothetical protein